MNSLPVSREVVLLGGGHAHVIVIKMWAMNPIEGVRLTLISEQGMTPYSGMLPGLVAGHYSYSQSHIDLPRLCQWANIRFIEQRATGIDPDRNKVLLPDRPDIYYDYLSVDTGGAPSLNQVAGARENAIPVKPVSTFYDRWTQIEKRIVDSPGGASLDIGVVGAGAGGFEILLAMHHRVQEFLRKRPSADRSLAGDYRFHWIIRSEVLPGATQRVRKMAITECERKGVILHMGFDVATVREDAVVAVDGKQISLDEVLWCTEAKASKWPAQSGLQCTDDGYIRINDYLQSISHPSVFAAGDVALQENYPRPRAGVFAVRQGPALFRNLQRAVLGKPLQIHRPQSHFLTLLSLGHQKAIASRGTLSVQGEWVWRWKDYIDQAFMNRFNSLPDMVGVRRSLFQRLKQAMFPLPRLDVDESIVMRCTGCGSKVPGDVLQQVLKQVIVNDAGTAEASETHRVDDVSLIRRNDRSIAQSVDQLRAMIADPFLFARITTLHALSDLYASNAAPHSALVSVTVPFASDEVLHSDLSQIMAGVVTELEVANCRLSGGHSAEGIELALGLTVNGLVNGELILKSGADANQALIMTKPLGVGVLLARAMRAQLSAVELDAALEVMMLSNQQAGTVAANMGATAMTDVTGFGLIGHLSEVMEQSNCCCELWAKKIPVLESAHSMALAGHQSSLFQANARYANNCGETGAAKLLTNFPLVFDPQTSGGLLFSLPVGNAEKCVSQLIASGYHSACVIGEIIQKDTFPNLSSEASQRIQVV